MTTWTQFHCYLKQRIVDKRNIWLSASWLINAYFLYYKHNKTIWTISINTQINHHHISKSWQNAVNWDYFKTDSLFPGQRFNLFYHWYSCSLNKIIVLFLIILSSFKCTLLSSDCITILKLWLILIQYANVHFLN